MLSASLVAILARLSLLLGERVAAGGARLIFFAALILLMEVASGPVYVIADAIAIAASREVRPPRSSARVPAREP